MEDWSKYIFDPKNPKGFKAYGLLKKILKDGNAMLVTDMYYFNELFKEEIWTKDVIEELWDVPDNFEDLSSNEKFQVYYKNFSKSDFLDKLESKLPMIQKTKKYSLFGAFHDSFEEVNFDNYVYGHNYSVFTSSKELLIKAVNFQYRISFISINN